MRVSGQESYELERIRELNEVDDVEDAIREYERKYVAIEDEFSGVKFSIDKAFEL